MDDLCWLLFVSPSFHVIIFPLVTISLFDLFMSYGTPLQSLLIGPASPQYSAPFSTPFQAIVKKIYIL